MRFDVVLRVLRIFVLESVYVSILVKNVPIAYYVLFFAYLA